jgi:hypothetical protein
MVNKYYTVAYANKTIVYAFIGKLDTEYVILHG